MGSILGGCNGFLASEIISVYETNVSGFLKK